MQDTCVICLESDNGTEYHKLYKKTCSCEYNICEKCVCRMSIELDRNDISTVIHNTNIKCVYCRVPTIFVNEYILQNIFKQCCFASKIIVTHADDKPVDEYLWIPEIGKYVYKWHIKQTGTYVEVYF